MCIACELGYLSMIDAIEAERSASKKKTASVDSPGANGAGLSNDRRMSPRRE
jgi:hypothetical protein